MVRGDVGPGNRAGAIVLWTFQAIPAGAALICALIYEFPANASRDYTEGCAGLIRLSVAAKPYDVTRQVVERWSQLFSPPPLVRRWNEWRREHRCRCAEIRICLLLMAS
jgi:hypothetical protein